VKEAWFYNRRDDRRVDCALCRHHCVINDGKRGVCGVRENRGGTLYSLVYGLPCSWHVDPIEKKPLYHFFPGSKAFSIATVGCNFRCLHCQNHDISQMARDNGRVFGQETSPEEVVALALGSGCRSISYTYTEPTIFFEYAYDIAKLAKEAGIFNNFVTNGYIEDEPLTTVRPYLDAANIDLKSISGEFYKKICGAQVEGVLASIKKYKQLGIWIEVTTLIIPGHNDSEEELRAVARFIHDETGPETPWHVSAFHPTYKLTDAPRTPSKALLRAREIGLEAGLRYVYTGNIQGLEGESTYCYQCKKPVIKRWGFSVTECHVKEGACAFCKARIDGVGL
jgi:pyruvate formate lyase activating enzyme